jgi:hypothetical protein
MGRKTEDRARASPNRKAAKKQGKGKKNALKKKQLQLRLIQPEKTPIATQLLERIAYGPNNFGAHKGSGED